MSETVKGSTVWDFKMLPMAVLTGDCNNESFLQENVRPFCWAKKSNHDNEVTILLRWLLGGFHSTTKRQGYP